jgi:hypothetical protein
MLLDVAVKGVFDFRQETAAIVSVPAVDVANDAPDECGKRRFREGFSLETRISFKALLGNDLRPVRDSTAGASRPGMCCKI